MYCIQCGTKAEEGNVFCAKCGAKINQTQPNYSTNGYQQPNYGYGQPQNAVYQGEQKSKIAAGLLALFLGSLGVHNFYLRKTGRAVAQLLLSISGFLLLIIFLASGATNWGIFILAVMGMSIGLSVAGIWALIEAILLLCGSIKTDGRGVPLM